MPHSYLVDCLPFSNEKVLDNVQTLTQASHVTNWLLQELD